MTNEMDELDDAMHTNLSLEHSNGHSKNEINGKLNRKESLVLNNSSTETEVAEWLDYKGFSSRCQELLFGYDGCALLNLKSKELEQILGRSEGHRMTVMLASKTNLCGYESECANELRAILQRRRALPGHENHNPTTGTREV